MTLPRTVADVLAGHVTLEVECIDRMYLNVYQPRLQHELGIVGFFKCHRGFPFVSSALMDPMTKAFVNRCPPVRRGGGRGPGRVPPR